MDNGKPALASRGYGGVKMVLCLFTIVHYIL